MSYSYVGNRLKKVDDLPESFNQSHGFKDNASFAEKEYEYDANGNMITDANKQLSNFSYDHNNMPTHIEISDHHKMEIDYIYSASGTKLKKITHKDFQLLDKTDYILNFVYKNNKLSYVITQEGKITFNQEGEPLYQYFLKDHLGNTRAVIDQEGHLAQTSSYYPFGMQTEALCYTSTTHQQNNYLYNGKELQDDFGLGWYDYGKRYYDAQIGRWHVVDPRAEKYDDLSPYNYCANNPLKYIDPEGDTIVVGNFIDRTLNKIGVKTTYVQKVEMDIAQSKLSGDSEVHDMITELENSPREHKIVRTKDEKDGNSVSLNMYKAKKGEKQGTTINYNPDKKTTVAGDFREPRVGLVHEMRHSNDADKGTMNFNKTSNGIPLYEIKAVKTENKVRKAIGVHRRTTYGGQNIPRGMLREDYKIK